jgi:hypothetical protein
MLNRTVIAVIAAMIDAGLPETSLTVSTKHLLDHPQNSTGVTEHEAPDLWTGLGKHNADGPERAQIAKRLDEKCILANAQLLPAGVTPASIDDVLRYLEIESRTTD